MNGVEKVVQCWGCPVFDRLFQVVSAAGADIYEKMIVWAWLVLVAFWAFYILWAVYLNLKDKEAKDWLYQESVKPVLINSLIICGLLGMGAAFPKLVASITFEPVASVASVYAESVLQVDAKLVDKKVRYTPEPMRDDGFFRPELRDGTIHLMKLMVAQFQTMIKLGLAVAGRAFRADAMFGPAGLLKHILMFALGAYLAYQFLRLSLRFCFYFVDVIVALAMFAFFFPFMLVFFVFKKSSAADWVKKMGDAFTSSETSLIKRVINTIISLVVAVITYTIVMVIIAKFFESSAMPSNEAVKNILAGTISSDMLGDANLLNLTLMGCVMLGLVLNYLTAQIPVVVDEIFKTMGVKPEDKMGKEIADVVEKSVKNLVTQVGETIQLAATGKAPEKEEKKDEAKKEDKKE
jgi:hypothetical protein